MPFTWNKVSAAVGLLAAFATGIIALDIVTVIPVEIKPLLIALITGLVGVFFPKGEES